MKRKEIAINNYKRFCNLKGSDYIASEFALETILRLIDNFNTTKILELGLGIGSVSDTILKFSKEKNLSIEYEGTERNEFCLEVLPQNIEDYEKICLYSELNQVVDKKFDLIIIDGSDNSIMEIGKYCLKNSMIYIEGGREVQAKNILKVFPKSLYVNVITLKKNPSYAHENRSVNSYIGGGQLIFINPNFKMRLFWFQQKIVTFMINKIRIYRKE